MPITSTYTSVKALPTPVPVTTFATVPFLSLTDLIQACIVRLQQVAGTAVQQYAEDHIAFLLNEAYEMMTKDKWWPNVMQWFSVALDGVYGMPTTSLRDMFVQQTTDLRALYYQDNNDPMPILPSTINPYQLTGDRGLYFEMLPSPLDVNGKLFRVWPLTATGNVRVHARVTPPLLFSDPSVLVPFDPTCLINYACWIYITSDASNPGASDNFQKVFNARKDQLMQQLNQYPVMLDTRRPYNSRGWQEVP